MKKDKEIKEVQQNAVQTAQFTPLDILGISVSTLLFTLVWVGVFSVFLPEKSELVFADGLKQLAKSQESESKIPYEIESQIQQVQSYVQETARGLLSTTLSVVQTGGNVSEMVELTRSHAGDLLCSVTDCSGPYELVVATHNAQEHTSFPQKVLVQTAEYLHSVKIRLLS